MNILLELMGNDLNRLTHRFNIYPNITIGINKNFVSYWFGVWNTDSDKILFSTYFQLNDKCHGHISTDTMSILHSKFQKLQTKEDLDKFISDLIKIEIFK